MNYDLLEQFSFSMMLLYQVDMFCYVLFLARFSCHSQTLLWFTKALENNMCKSLAQSIFFMYKKIEKGTKNRLLFSATY